MNLKLAEIYRRFADGMIPIDTQWDPERLRQANRVVGFSLAMLIWVPIFAVIYLALGGTLASNIILSGGVLIQANLLLLRRGRSPHACGNILTSLAWYVYTGLALLTGGPSSPVMPWYATLPILSVLLAGNRSGYYWTAATAFTISLMTLASSLGVTFQETVSPPAMRVLWLTGLIGLSYCIYVLVSALKNMENIARQALYEANGRLELQATTDGLTGIYNRRAFDRVLDQEWKRHERAGLPLSVLLIDADYFKQYNDAYGHLAGDDCLRSIARAIQCMAHRSGDFVARYGGEEFAVILPLTDENGAGRIAEEIRRHIQSLAMPHCRSDVAPHVTVSIGTTSAVPTQCRSHQDFLQDADVALYRAKAAGRNETVHMGPITVEAG